MAGGLPDVVTIQEGKVNRFASFSAAITPFLLSGSSFVTPGSQSHVQHLG